MQAPLPPQTTAALRDAIRRSLYTDESEFTANLLRQAETLEAGRERIAALATDIIGYARARRSDRSPLEVFLHEFGLSTEEGLSLLCLAEALLRVPDSETADNLIAEKIGAGTWKGHGRSESSLVNVLNQALAFTSSVVALDEQFSGTRQGMLSSLVNRLGEPVVRTAIRQAMRIMGNEFVVGRNIEEALGHITANGSIASFDMLGEGARTAAQAQNHLEAYLHCFRTIAVANKGGLYSGHGVSVKLSALHPRYEHANRRRVLTELLPRLKMLALHARAGSVNMTIDAEEASRLDLSLDLVEALARDPELRGWEGLGLAVQCYSKRAPAVLDWIVALSRELQRRFMVRLVKGAYWDTEIKRAQELGLGDYPVFTRKSVTDLCYLVCARKALSHPEAVYPQFATHNAHTIASVLELAGTSLDFEFQRLHGMGELLYEAALATAPRLPRVRIYAPVGAHKDLLAYLVRRLLENGANTSFVNRYMDEQTSIRELVENPVEKARAHGSRPGIALPPHLYGDARRNSTGIDLSDPLAAQALLKSLAALKRAVGQAAPIVSGVRSDGMRIPVRNPAHRGDTVGFVVEARSDDIEMAISAAKQAQLSWDAAGADARARILERTAEMFETQHDRFISLLVREAGKTLSDAIAEIRETVDFCRYYAAQAREHFGSEKTLTGPTGERNSYSLHGRGAFVCISPWNFPLAIFVGQIAAALAAGNTVLAKPAEQTPLIAAAAVDAMFRCGVPADVLQFLPGRGEIVGERLVSDERTAGVVMTGSLSTAQAIARALAARKGSIVPLIAETGGQNAMFVDSTALAEQVVDDVVRSAFHSAGQRCSALRVLYVQDDVYDDMIDMVKGAMDELRVGDPADLSTDIGPIIDEAAREELLAHVAQLRASGSLLHEGRLSDDCVRGLFVAPHLFSIDSVEALAKEHFGPLLHVVRYRSRDLERHLHQLRATGYGLTLGVHTRIEAVARHIFRAMPAGNVYVNRNMIGAVVGVQPFGGHGLSGTGPKAGGPLYLQRFAIERVLTVNTAATGGNVELLRMQTEG